LLYNATFDVYGSHHSGVCSYRLTHQNAPQINECEGEEQEGQQHDWNPNGACEMEELPIAQRMSRTIGLGGYRA